MPKPDPKLVAKAYLDRGIGKNAGEVIFKKDRGGDAASWAYADHAPSRRDIPQDFNYSPRNQRPLAEVLLSTLAALGHTLSAHNAFAKIKSARVSPDGNLGGRGYIMKIADMRKQFMNCVEALSALSDTLFDEVNAPHWSLFSRQEAPEDQAAVSALIDGAESIRQDPENWAEGEIEEEFGDGPSDESEGDNFEDDSETVVEYDDNGSWGLWEDVSPEDEERAVNKTARDAIRDIRLRLRVPRIAYEWLARSGEQPVGIFPLSVPPEELPPEGFDPGQMATDDPSNEVLAVIRKLLPIPAEETTPGLEGIFEQPGTDLNSVGEQ